MTIQELEKQLQKYKIIPVATIEKLDFINSICTSLIKGELPIIEITFRNSLASKAIETAKKLFPNMIIGAGSVLSKKMAKLAIQSKADFIVSPGFDKDTVKYCAKKNIACIPGVATPTEIQECYNLGLSIVKIFPCELLGGANYIKAISAPYPTMKFVPTGGINEENYKEYLNIPSVASLGGSWMVCKELQMNNKWQTITECCLKIKQSIFS